MYKYYLENEYGQQLNILDYKNFVSRNFSGFGFSYKSKYFGAGNAYILNEYEKDQKEIKFECEIISNLEENYKKITNFIIKSKKLILVIDKGVEQYCIQVKIEDLDKKDLTFTYILNLTFSGLTLYYKKINKKYSLNNGVRGNKWDVKWDFKFVDNVVGSMEIENFGQEEAGFEAEIFGPSVNPYIEFEDGNRIVFNLEIKSGESILYSNLDSNIYVLKKDSKGLTTNIIDTLNVENDNFRKLKIGKNNLKIGDNITEAIITMYENYITI